MDSQQPESHKSQSRSCLLYGCLTVLAIGIILAAAGISLYLYGASEFEPLCTRYFTLINEKHFQLAYDEISPAWQKDQSFEQFSAFHEDMLNKLGTFQSGNITGIEINADLEGSEAKIVYQATFSKAENCSITFYFGKYDDKWKINGMEYNCDNLEKNKPAPQRII